MTVKTTEIEEVKRLLHEADTLLCEIAQREEDERIQQYLYALSIRYVAPMQHDLSKLKLAKMEIEDTVEPVST